MNLLIIQTIQNLYFSLSKTSIICILVICSYQNAHAQFNYPGGLIELLIDKKSSQLPQVRYGTREPVIIEHANRWQILVGLSLETLPGDYLVYIKRTMEDSRAFTLTFKVEQKDYSVLSGNRQKKDVYINHTSFSDLDFNNTEQPSLPLRYPLQGEWIKKFGNVLNANNNEVIQQNLIATRITQIGTVVAPHNAIVSRIETNEFDISSVFLDHGRGLYSIIHGITDLSVEIGNGVVGGAVLGKTPYYEGRASYVSWQCVMNGVYINPVILAELP